jgi:hypothetical protein
MMGYGVKVKMRDDDWIWYAGSSQKTGVRRVTFHTIEEGEEWCKTFNINGIVEEYDVRSFCEYQEDLFDKCNFCDCWKKDI